MSRVRSIRALIDLGVASLTFAMKLMQFLVSVDAVADADRKLYADDRKVIEAMAGNIPETR